MIKEIIFKALIIDKTQITKTQNSIKVFLHKI